MKIIIIEDEALTAEDLEEYILAVNSDIQIMATLTSVENAVAWFVSNEPPDLIFSDIQLGDGLSFEIFQKASVSVPVIFCTAFDEYAINAFKANGIDYILKPFDRSDIANALQHYEVLEKKFSVNNLPIDSILQLFKNKEEPQKRKSVLVYYKDKILPIWLDTIAVFYIENKITYLITFDQIKYIINKPLDELESIIGTDFFRANRQCIFQRKAVKEASQYFARSLSITLTIPFDEKIKVTKVKVPVFLSWLSGL